MGRIEEVTRSEKDKPANPAPINTGGGAYIGGSVTAGGHVVGRDQINVGGAQGLIEKGVALATMLAAIATRVF